MAAVVFLLAVSVLHIATFTQTEFAASCMNAMSISPQNSSYKQVHHTDDGQFAVGAIHWQKYTISERIIKCVSFSPFANRTIKIKGLTYFGFCEVFKDFNPLAIDGTRHRSGVSRAGEEPRPLQEEANAASKTTPRRGSLP